MGSDGRLQDEIAQRAETMRDTELADRIAAQAEQGPRGPHTRADEKRLSAFARQRPAVTPDADAEPPADARASQGRTTTVVQLSSMRRTRVRRGAGKPE